MSANNPSAPQRIAADPNYSAWVTANAGSGKTKVLIDRVARLLLGRAEDGEAPPDPSKILCLTYTRAAAATMQNKLFARLGGWALMDEADLRDALIELDEKRGKSIDLKRARRLFAQALETPGGLKIQTIHAFCESLLRRFPLEARISPHFELMDEIASVELLAEAKEATIQRALSDGNSALRDATLLIVDRVQEFGIDALINEIIKQRIAFEGTTDQVIARIAEALDVDEDETIEKARASVLAELERGLLRDLTRELENGGKHEQTVAPALLAALAEGTDTELLDALQAAVLTKTGTPRKSFPTAKIKKALPWAEDCCVEIADLLIGLRAHEAGLEAYVNSKALARFGVALLGEVRTLKARADLVDFDDLIRLASGLLTQAEARDWVRFKLDGGVDHILVDEAQDTSAEQWQVIGAIAEEFFQGTSAREHHRTLFVVGDEKQSIYSFQGADPSGLAKIKERFTALTEAAEKSMQSPRLLHSFRSTPAVLNAVDSVFASAGANDGLGEDGVAPEHLAFREDQPGKVEFWPLVEPEPDPDESPWYEPVDQKPPNAPHLRLAEGIATRIRQWLDDQTPIPARDRAIRPGDILILVRRRNAFADAMIRALKARDIPVAGEDRMALTQQLAVRDLMALVRFALLPDDDLTLAAVLRSPIVGVSEEALFELAHHRDGRRLWNTLYQRRDEAAFAKAFEILDDLQKQADFMRPYEFLDRALMHHGARARFLGRLGVQSEDPIDELLNQALAFESVETPTLQAFVERIDENDFQVKREMEQGRDEVRVMTAHGAKGLEAKVVFLPDTVALPPSNRSGLFVLETEGGTAPVWSARTEDDPVPVSDLRTDRKARELQEYRRLLYVGMTRAEDWLIVCGYRGGQYGNKKDGTKRLSHESWLQVIENGFSDAIECETPLLSEDKMPIKGLMIESGGEKRAKPDPLISEKWSPRPPDPGLMIPVYNEGGVEPSISPSRLCNDDPTEPPPLPSESEEGAVIWSSAERGTLIHGLLERLAAVPVDQRRALGGRGLETSEGHAALETVLNIMESTDFAWMFGEGSLAEVPIAGPVAALGERSVSGSIDRLVVREGYVDVVDFKTGQPHDPLPEAYQRQLAVYQAVVQEIYPAAKVNAHLLWIDTARIVTMNDSDLRAALGRARQQLVSDG